MYAKPLQQLKYDADNICKVADGIWFKNLNSGVLLTPDAPNNFILGQHVLCIESDIEKILQRLDYKPHPEIPEIGVRIFKPGVTFVRFQPRFYSPHNHPEDDESIVILYGNSIFSVENKLVETYPGKLLDFPAGTEHGLKPEKVLYLLSLMQNK